MNCGCQGSECQQCRESDGSTPRAFSCVEIALKPSGFGARVKFSAKASGLGRWDEGGHPRIKDKGDGVRKG
jgi:hypothetical protein